MVCHYAWKDNFCTGIVAIWLRSSKRLGFGDTMARTVYRAKRSGYVPRKVGREMWHSADIPQDIRRPWDIFHEDAVEFGHEDGHEDLRAVRKLGALRAFQELPACRQRYYTETSLQELAAFAAWSAACN